MWGTPHFLGWGICEVSFFQTTGSTAFRCKILDFLNQANCITFFSAQSGMLTLQETTDIFLNFTAKQKPSLLYPVKSRY